MVTATRLTEAAFWQHSYLGCSLRKMPIELRPPTWIVARNRGVQGLSAIYNQALQNAEPEQILIMVHDDVYIHDWFIG